MPYGGSREAIGSVLCRLGIDPHERFGDRDQDPEYTACRRGELGEYFRLYRSDGLTTEERAVLACFMLEGLNEVVGEGGKHPLHEEILEALFDARIHAQELSYWMDTSDPDASNWWPITKSLVSLQRARDLLELRS